ncbi:MAG: DUF4129 domain-containing protein [Actinomycetota bacterium]
MPSSVRLGWLAVPAFLAVLVLVGLGASTESANEFERRTERGQAETQPEFRPDPDGDVQRTPQPSDAPDVEPGEIDDVPPAGEGAEITIVSETGEIVVQLGEDGRPVRLTPVGDDGAPIDIDPDDLVGIRLGEDGQLEIVPLDEIGPDDTVVVPADGGFDLLRPDGSRVEFRADGENDGVTATEISPDGEATELVPNADGSVTLSDGTTVGPIDIAEDGGALERLIDRTRDLPWPWLVAALLVLIGGSIALAYHLHRNRPEEGLDLSGLAGASVSDDRFEQFLATLTRDPDPSRAIRIGFSVAERGLGGTPPRRADETPFEWQARVATHQPDAGAPVGQVCDLFARVRFAPGQATDADRRAMIAALQDLHRRRGATAEPVGV